MSDIATYRYAQEEDAKSGGGSFQRWTKIIIWTLSIIILIGIIAWIITGPLDALSNNATSLLNQTR